MAVVWQEEPRILLVVHISHGVICSSLKGNIFCEQFYTFLPFFYPHEILEHTQSVLKSQIKQYPNENTSNH